MNLKNVSRGLAAIGAAALLSACGGGQVDAFKPDRILAFGDELGLVNPGGSKYSVNALKSGTTDLDCATYPVWTQVVAKGFDLVFPECNPDNVASPTSRMLASNGAKVADFAAQVSAFKVAGGAFTNKDLVTVMVGMHDVLELYAQYPDTLTEAQITAELQTRGRAWAAQQNSIAREGARVLVSTIPNLGLTPYALAEDAAHPGEERAKLLTRLTDAFNLAMRLDQIQDGRMIALVLGDVESKRLVDNPGSWSLSNVKDPVCTVALPGCTTTTVISDATDKPTQWMWADTLHPSVQFQKRLGDVAQFQAEHNPF